MLSFPINYFLISKFKSCVRCAYFNSTYNEPPLSHTTRASTHTASLPSSENSFTSQSPSHQASSDNKYDSMNLQWEPWTWGRGGGGRRKKKGGSVWFLKCIQTENCFMQTLMAYPMRQNWATVITSLGITNQSSFLEKLWQRHVLFLQCLSLLT